MSGRLWAPRRTSHLLVVPLAVASWRGSRGRRRSCWGTRRRAWWTPPPSRPVPCGRSWARASGDGRRRCRWWAAGCPPARRPRTPIPTAGNPRRRYRLLPARGILCSPATSPYSSLRRKRCCPSPGGWKWRWRSWRPRGPDLSAASSPFPPPRRRWMRGSSHRCVRALLRRQPELILRRRVIAARED